MQIEIKKLDGSEVEIVGELPYEKFGEHEERAIKEIGENLEVAGFRKGKVPKDILLTKIPESAILEKMADLALPGIYSKILDEHQIQAIGRPEITITKLAKGNPFGFKIKTAVIPEVKLPDYKKIAASETKNMPEEKFDVAEEEIEKTILDIRKMRASKTHKHKHEEGEVHDHEIKEAHLPAFDDEFVKGLGSFQSVEEFKNRIRENIKLDKENHGRERNRVKILEKIIEATKTELPEILINAELDKMIYRLKSDIGEIGLAFDAYLKQIGKTEEDLRKEWRAEAEKRTKLGLVLDQIAKAENLEASPEEIEAETEKLMATYPGIEKIRARSYVENILVNEKVFQFLENSKK